MSRTKNHYLCPKWEWGQLKILEKDAGESEKKLIVNAVNFWEEWRMSKITIEASKLHQGF